MAVWIARRLAFSRMGVTLAGRSARALLEVEGAFRVGQQVDIPAPASRCARNVQMPSDILEPELGAAGLPGFPAPGGYIDGAVAFQGMFHLLVHRPSPVAWMAPTSAVYPS